MSVYESIKDATDEEFASYVIDKAYIKAKKEIDKAKKGICNEEFYNQRAVYNHYINGCTIQAG